MYVGDLVTVTAGYWANDFKHYSLEVHLGPRGTQLIGDRHVYAQRVVVAGDDVAQLCCLLPRICYYHFIRLDGWEWVSRTVDVEINVRSNAIAEDEKDGCDNDPPLVKRLLEPFRQLYGYNVAVEGHVTTCYKESIEASAAQPPPTASDVVCIVSKGRDEGHEAMQMGSLGIALSRYQLALHFMTSNSKRLAVINRNLGEWRITDKSDLIAMDMLQLNLRSLLADAYLKVGQYAKSYACAQDLDCRYPLHPEADLSVQSDLVRLMLCKARAGKALGEPVQALRDIDEALGYSPDDEALKEERKKLCGLLRKKLDADVRITWAGGLTARTGKLKKPKNSRKVKRAEKPQYSAPEGYSLNVRRDLERLMDKKEIA